MDVTDNTSETDNGRFAYLLTQLRGVAEAYENGAPSRLTNVPYWNKITDIASEFRSHLKAPLFILCISSTDLSLDVNRQYIFKNPANLLHVVQWLLNIHTDTRTVALRTIVVNIVYIQDPHDIADYLHSIPPQVLGLYDDPVKTRLRILADFEDEYVPDPRNYLTFVDKALRTFLDKEEEIPANQNMLEEMERADERAIAKIIAEAAPLAYMKKRKD
jgi:hypothetical protein